MKYLILLSILLFSCSEEEEPSFSCDQIRVISDKSYTAWMEVLKHKGEMKTLQETLIWNEQNNAAREAYLEVERLISKNCYNHKTKTSY